MDTARVMPLTVHSCRNLLVFTGIFTFLVSSVVEPRASQQPSALSCAVWTVWGRGRKVGADDEAQVDAYPLYAASALAANAFVRCLFAGESIADTGQSAENLLTRKSPL
jgi:hypothetical protein